jgi:hypothetical protein
MNTVPRIVVGVDGCRDLFVRLGRRSISSSGSRVKTSLRWRERAPGRLRGRPGASLFMRLVVAQPDAEVLACVEVPRCV